MEIGEERAEEVSLLLLVEDTYSVTKIGRTLFPDPHSQSNHLVIEERVHNYDVNQMALVKVLDDDV